MVFLNLLCFSFLFLIYTYTCYINHFFRSNQKIYVYRFSSSEEQGDCCFPMHSSCRSVPSIPSHCCHLSQGKSTLLWLRGIYVKMISFLSLLFSSSGKSCTAVLFLCFFTSTRIIMTIVISSSQVQLFSSCPLSPLSSNSCPLISRKALFFPCFLPISLLLS